ncbi:hypothetical protein ACH4C2_16220 [Streptomyces sp. NPDC018057]|uniref:hypothetical protein n=1 Tax=unclassified Streptomyces TaxID=2593676 RepID=UPI0037AA6BFC
MVVAVLLLPFVGALLLIMDRIEDRVSAPAPARGRPARHRGHLRLVPGGRRTAVSGAARDGRDPAAPAPGRDAESGPVADEKTGDGTVRDLKRRHAA